MSEEKDMLEPAEGHAPVDEPEAREAAGEPEDGPHRALAPRVLMVALGLCLAAGAGVAAGSLIYGGAGDAGSPLPATAGSAADAGSREERVTSEDEADAGCEHDWTAVYDLRDVPAKTHVEHHATVYGTETSYETVCNACGAVITGETDRHRSETGHEGYTTGVPIENEVVERDAYDETVVDEPAAVELVHTSDECAVCGEVRDVPDEVVETRSAR